MHPVEPDSLTVVIMAFNEAATLGGVVEEVRATLADLPQASEILVVDDGSTDETRAVLAPLVRDGVIRLVSFPTNRGLGEVYRAGYEQARSTFVTFFPADGQFPASLIPAFVHQIAMHDLVLGYLPQRRGDLAGRFLSMAQRMVYRVLVGRLPRFQGVHMVRTSLVRSLGLRSQGRAATIVFELFLRAVRAKARIVSIPTTVRPRRHGASKVNNFRTIWVNLKQAARLRRVLAR